MPTCFRMVHIVTALLVTLSGMTVTALLGSPRPADAQGVEDAAQLRNLAERVLAPVGFPGLDQTQPPRAQLLLGRLPADFPFDLPMPQGGRLVGSAVRSMGDQMSGVQVVIDAPGPAISLVEFYERELQARGWDTPANMMSGSGVFKPPEAARSAYLCQGDTGAYVSVNAYQPPSGPTDVRLSVSTPITSTSTGRQALGPCSAESYGYGGPSSVYRLLPRLSAPQGVQLQAGMAAPMISGQDTASSEATAITEIPAGQLESYFAEQLQRDGWSRIDGGSTQRLAWSEWLVPGEEGYYGYLLVLELPGENRRRLSVRVESPTSTLTPGVMYVGPF